MAGTNWDDYSATEKVLTDKGQTFQEEQQRNLEILRKVRPDLAEQAPHIFTGPHVSPQQGTQQPLAPGMDTTPTAPAPDQAPARGATPSQPQPQGMPQAPGAMASPEAPVFDNLARGAKGGRVTTLQENLIDLGYDVGGVDGIFGGGVQRGLEKFQKDFGLPDTGIYDRATAEAMAGAPEVIGQQQDPRGEANPYTKGYEGGQADFSLGTFVDYIAGKEGTKEHMGPEGQLTLGYGILPSTARSHGIDYEDFNGGKTPEDRRNFAEAVYGKMYESAAKKYPSIFDSTELSSADKIAALSLYINVGTLYSSTVKAIESGDMKKVGESLSGIIHYPELDANGNRTGVRFNSLGLSKRRAQEYNEMLGKNQVTEVKRSGNTYTWLDSEGNVLFTKTGSGVPDNTSTRISVPTVKETKVSPKAGGPRFIAGTDQNPEGKKK